MNESAERWLSFAREDLAAARSVQRDGLSNQACFHAQQCVEKCLKGLLAGSDALPPKTHSIQELLNRLPLPVLSLAEEELVELDDYYITTRYPDAVPGSLPEGLPSGRDAARAIALADRVLADVEERSQ